MDNLKEVLAPQARSVTLRDRNVFRDFFSRVKNPLSDTTFTMRHIWARPLRHTWTVINENLCVFGFLKDRHVLWGPPIGGKMLNDTVTSCFDIVGRLNQRKGIDMAPIAIYIPESMKETYEKVAKETGSSLGEWTQDYVYDTRQLIELSGPKFESQRHKIDFFEKNYDYETEEFDYSRHVADCLRLIGLWRDCKMESIGDAWGYELDSEASAARRVIKFSRRLGVGGIVLKVDGQVAGISLGEPLTGEMCSNIIEKTNPAVKGASEFIFREFAKYWSSYRFVNAQDDFGVDYLRKIKLAYNPVMLLKSYCLEKK